MKRFLILSCLALGSLAAIAGDYDMRVMNTDIGSTCTIHSDAILTSVMVDTYVAEPTGEVIVSVPVIVGKVSRGTKIDVFHPPLS